MLKKHMFELFHNKQTEIVAYIVCAIILIYIEH